ncbi:hypothetical protein T484DRAFT_1782803 [Baffinella frigidus]|nr:hypothetical protein T484DRAFT_1782803 [Cryptophyta sp. CCMP2293]
MTGEEEEGGKKGKIKALKVELQRIRAKEEEAGNIEALEVELQWVRVKEEEVGIAMPSYAWGLIEALEVQLQWVLAKGEEEAAASVLAEKHLAEKQEEAAATRGWG